MAKQGGNDEIIMIGDLNADPNYANGPKLKFFAESNNFIINVTRPTRITPAGATILDQILSSSSLTITECTVGYPFYTRDHCSISCNTSLTFNNKEFFTRNVWDFKNADWAGLRVCLNTLKWEACLASDNVDICATFWTKTYLETAKKFIPFRSVRIRHNDKPWYCNKLRALKRKRDRLFRKAKLSKLASDWVTYKRSRNEYAHELSKSVSEHDNKILNSINDNKMYEKGWWRTIRVFFNGVHQKIPALQTDDGCVFSNFMDKANLFNKMFSSHSELNAENRVPPT